MEMGKKDFHNNQYPKIIVHFGHQLGCSYGDKVIQNQYR